MRMKKTFLNILCVVYCYLNIVYINNSVKQEYK